MSYVWSNNWKDACRRHMNAKEQYIKDHQRCPNCGETQFYETHTNAAEGFRCECGLEFNLMSVLGIVDITRDPKPDLPRSQWAKTPEPDPVHEFDAMKADRLAAAMKEVVDRATSPSNGDKVASHYLKLAMAICFGTGIGMMWGLYALHLLVKYHWLP